MLIIVIPYLCSATILNVALYFYKNVLFYHFYYTIVNLKSQLILFVYVLKDCIKKAKMSNRWFDNEYLKHLFHIIQRLLGK